jgi:hypothetical protein
MPDEHARSKRRLGISVTRFFCLKTSLGNLPLAKHAHIRNSSRKLFRIKVEGFGQQ